MFTIVWTASVWVDREKIGNLRVRHRERYKPINLDRLPLYVDMKLNCTAVGRQMSEFVTSHAVCYSCSGKIQNGLPLLCRLTHFVLEKRLLNGCSSSSSTSSSCARIDEQLSSSC